MRGLSTENDSAVYKQRTSQYCTQKKPVAPCAMSDSRVLSNCCGRQRLICRTLQKRFLDVERNLGVDFRFRGNKTIDYNSSLSDETCRLCKNLYSYNKFVLSALLPMLFDLPSILEKDLHEMDISSWRARLLVKKSDMPSFLTEDPLLVAELCETSSALANRLINRITGHLQGNAAIAVDRQDECGRTQLTEAIHQNSNPHFSSSPSHLGTDTDRSGPLCYAAERGKLESVRMLLRRGSDVNQRREDGKSPLACAANEGHHLVVKYLLRQGGIDINLADNEGRTALHEVTSSETPSEWVLKLLLAEPELNINALDNQGRTPLWYAISHRNSEVVEWLSMEKRIQIHPADKEESACIQQAISSKQLALIGQVLEKKDRETVNGNIRDSMAPLDLAKWVSRRLAHGVSYSILLSTLERLNHH